MRLIVSVCLFVLASAMLLRAEAPSVGDSAPPFALKGSDGKVYELKQFIGKKPVVVAWFPKAFTGG